MRGTLIWLQSSVAKLPSHSMQLITATVPSFMARCRPSLIHPRPTPHTVRKDEWDKRRKCHFAAQMNEWMNEDTQHTAQRRRKSSLNYFCHGKVVHSHGMTSSVELSVCLGSGRTVVVNDNGKSMLPSSVSYIFFLSRLSNFFIKLRSSNERENERRKYGGIEWNIHYITDTAK